MPLDRVPALNVVLFAIAGIFCASVAIAIHRHFAAKRAQAEREKHLQELARRRNFDGNWSKMPGSFPTEILDRFFSYTLVKWPRWGEIRNVVGGSDGADYLLAFDVRVKSGRTRVSRTVIARRSANLAVKPHVSSTYKYTRWGEWHAVITSESVFFALSAILPMVEIERQWELLGQPQSP